MSDEMENPTDVRLEMIVKDAGTWSDKSERKHSVMVTIPAGQDLDEIRIKFQSLCTLLREIACNF